MSMSDEEKSPFIGKFVCYNAVDGGACWGRIKAECTVNTMSGEKEAFILEGRMVAYLRASLGVTVKTFKPGLLVPVRTAALDLTTGKLTDDVGIEVKKFKGDTLIRKDVIDLERDVIDLGEFHEKFDSLLGNLSEDALFLALMRGQSVGLCGNKALELGLNQLMGSDVGLEERVKQELRKRLEKTS
jgi:hypothetical protein